MQPIQKNKNKLNIVNVKLFNNNKNIDNIKSNNNHIERMENILKDYKPNNELTDSKYLSIINNYNNIFINTKSKSNSSIYLQTEPKSNRVKSNIKEKQSQLNTFKKNLADTNTDMSNKDETIKLLLLKQEKQDKYIKELLTKVNEYEKYFKIINQINSDKGISLFGQNDSLEKVLEDEVNKHKQSQRNAIDTHSKHSTKDKNEINLVKFKLDEINSYHNKTSSIKVKDNYDLELQLKSIVSRSKAILSNK